MSVMHRRALVMLALLALGMDGCTLWRAKRVNAWGQATGGEHFERLLWKEVQARNWIKLERRLAPTFVSIAPTGVRDRAASLEDFKAMTITNYALVDVSVQPNGHDLVVTYTLTLAGTHNGMPLPACPQRRMTVWQQGGRGWMAIAHSSVPVACP